MNPVCISNLERRSRESKSCICLVNGQSIALSGRIQAHELRVARLESTIYVGALHVDLTWCEGVRNEIVRLHIAATVVLTKKVSFTHALWREKPLANWEFVHVTVLNWGPGAMPDHFEDKCELFVLVL